MREEYFAALRSIQSVASRQWCYIMEQTTTNGGAWRGRGCARSRKKQLISKRSQSRASPECDALITHALYAHSLRPFREFFCDVSMRARV